MDPKNRNLNFVIFTLIETYKKDGKIIALCLGIRLNEFMKIIKPYEIVELDPLFDMTFSEDEKDNTIYLDGVSVDKQYMNQGVALKFFVEMSN